MTDPYEIAPYYLPVRADLRIGSLARLLIEKGVFTEAEYVAAVTKAEEDEAAAYLGLRRPKT